MNFFQMYKEKKQNQKTKKVTERFIKQIKDIIVKENQQSCVSLTDDFVKTSFEYGDREYLVYASHSKNKWTETTFEIKIRTGDDYISIGKYDERKDITIAWNEKFTSKVKNAKYILDHFEKIVQKNKSKTTARAY